MCPVTMNSGHITVGLLSASRTHLAAAKPFNHDIHVAAAIAVMTLLSCAVLCCAVLCGATQKKACSSDMDTAVLASCWQVQIMLKGQAIYHSRNA